MRDLSSEILSQNFKDVYPHFFNKPPSFHLTLNLLSLTTQEQEVEAVKVLKGLQDKLRQVVGIEPVKLNLKGLNVFPGIELSKSFYCILDLQ